MTTYLDRVMKILTDTKEPVSFDFIQSEMNVNKTKLKFLYPAIKKGIDRENIIMLQSENEKRKYKGHYYMLSDKPIE